jgi:hypothetical protein
MYMRYWNGTGTGAARIESYDSATYAITYINTAGSSGVIGCAKDASLRFTQGGQDASVDYNYTGAGGTGTTFTIGTGLGVVAGNIMVYSTTATMTKWAQVSSYTSGTGVLVLTTSITLVAGLMNFFNPNLDRGSYVNDCCAIGAGALQNFACGQTAPMTGNCAFGQMALNGAGGGYDNASFLAGNLNTAFGNRAGSWNTSDCANNTFLGANSDILVPYSVITNSTAIGYNAKLDLSNLIALGTSTETVRCWDMDVRGLPTLSAGLSVTAGTIDFSGNVPICTGVPVNGSDLVNKTYVDSSFHPIGSYVDLTTNQTVGGVKSFTSNLRAIATTGDVFQAFKNSVVGNAGHVLINDLGNLSYFDTSASLIKWRLDTDGKLTVGNIDISGTMINKTTTAGDFIRSNSNASQYFYASNNGNIGFTDSSVGAGYGWFINANGNARFRSSTNSFKYWEFFSNQFRYYNLGGTHSIILNGDTGAITTPGSITSSSIITGNIISSGNLVTNDIECVNIESSGDINCGNINSTGDIGVVTINSTGEVNTVNVVASNDITASNNISGFNITASQVLAGQELDIQGNTSKIIFSGATASIRIGLNSTVTTDANDDNINIGNDSTALGGLNFVGGKSAIGQVRSVAVGSSSVAGTNAVAVGSGASSNNAQSIAVGHLAIVNGQQSVGVGEGVLASSLQGVAIGAEAESTNTQVISIGYQAKGNQVNAIAIGALSQANGIESIAIGFEARANFNNSVSIGDGVQATAVNDFRLGNASNKILLKQIYFPFEISPTNISATGGLPASPYYGIYRVTAGSSITITLPTITTAMDGMIITFRKTGPLTIVVSITCSAGNTYLPLNSTTSTAAGTATTLLNTSSATGRVMVISGSQWAVCT